MAALWILPVLGYTAAAMESFTDSNLHVQRDLMEKREDNLKGEYFGKVSEQLCFTSVLPVVCDLGCCL